MSKEADDWMELSHSVEAFCKTYGIADMLDCVGTTLFAWWTVERDFAVAKEEKLERLKHLDRADEFKMAQHLIFESKAEFERWAGREPLKAHR